MFGITTATDFRAKAARDNAALQAEIENADLAINATLSAYHLHEWVWRLVLKPIKPALVRGTALRAKDDWVEWLDANCPHFGLLQELANGSKHCLPVAAAVQVEGFGEGPYGIGPYGLPYLLIDLGEEIAVDQRWLVANTILQEVNDFWTDLATELNF
ncbi:MAG: hypothetical protein ACK4MI_02385 [Brevundimonas sp.]|uniref:hypothetical protein n=1 Tax=Brevundimonas sp. TaxID=1871086 RepID=UPI0028D63C1B|nr:hypothetical protein [uncultured Brevundimonas sp.]